MAYSIPTEVQSAAAEFGFDGLDNLYDLFVEAVAILKGQGNAMLAASVFRSGEKLPTSFPAIRLELEQSNEEHIEIGGSGTGKRLVTARYTVTVMDRMGADLQKVTRSHAQLADRVRDLLSRNRTLDGFCEDLTVSPARYGFYAPRVGRLIAAQLRVDVENRVPQT